MMICDEVRTPVVYGMDPAGGLLHPLLGAGREGSPHH